MKKLLVYILLSVLCQLTVSAQSTMTDDQIMNFVAREYKAGTSQAQIVTKLIQRGVDIDRIRNIKRKDERQAKQQGLGGKIMERKKTRKDNTPITDCEWVEV